MGAIGRSGAVGLGILLILAALAFVADAVDPEAVVPGPARPALWREPAPARVPASIGPLAAPSVVAADPRAPPRA